ncbi:MAG: hypothetical protein Q8M16_16535 [Pirellulaceae bacterium]|nr:hypothetical protein [Pirellulaceae bacterium]
MLGKSDLQWLVLGVIGVYSWSVPDLFAQGERRGSFQRGSQEGPVRGGQEGAARGGQETGGQSGEDRGRTRGGESGRGDSRDEGTRDRRGGSRGEGNPPSGENRFSGSGTEGRGTEGRRGEVREGESRERRAGSSSRNRSNTVSTGTRRDQVINQLVALDLNKDGRLDPSDGEGNVLSANIMKLVGLDPGLPVHVETLRGLVNQIDLEKVQLDDDAGIRAEDAPSSFDFPRVSRRRPASSDFAVHPVLSDPKPLEERYSALILGEVRSLLARYDDNGNGVLDASEISNVPWGPPSPLESDLDQNGQLNEVELAERLNTLSGGESPSTRRARTRGDRGPSTPEADAARAEREAAREKAAAERRERDRSRRSSGTDRVATYVKDLLTRYDKDSDGMMSFEEASEMRNPPPKSADSDKDGKLTESELYAYYSDGQSPSSSSGSSRSSRRSQDDSDRGPLPGTIFWDGELARRSDASEKEWPSDLDGKDTNGDQMISLAEFATDLDSAKREAFARWDTNRDGYITRTEAAGGNRSSGSSTRESSEQSATPSRAVGGRRPGSRSNRGGGDIPSNPKPAEARGQAAPNSLRYNIFGN